MKKQFTLIFFFTLLFFSAQAQLIVLDSTVVKKDTGKVYESTELEKQAEYPGGFGAMSQFLQANIKYPQKEKENGIRGKVFIAFIILSTGEIGDVKILKGVSGCAACDAEAVRVIKMFPKWKPGTIAGVPVNSRFNIPISFYIDSNVPPPPPKKD